MATLQDIFPFAAASMLDDRHTWGVWDKHRRCWIERPCYCREAAERLASSFVEAYAAGFADGALNRAGSSLPRRRHR